jgi:hypothetical protein
MSNYNSTGFDNKSVLCYTTYFSTTEQRSSKMTKSINKQYKFVYIRDDRYDRSFDGNDFSAIRAKYPKFVIGNKKPEGFVYSKGVRANDFMGLYLDDYSKYSTTKSFTEAEWTQLILKFCKQEVSKLKKQLKDAGGSNSYYGQVREMLIPIYKNEVKVWKQKHKQLTDSGVYTYLELCK